MIELLQKSFPKSFKGWQPKLKEMMPGYGVKLNDNPELAVQLEEETAKALQLEPVNATKS
jgi:malate dehydrogenase (quinone)